ncbi:MAG: hypothetical protein JWO44_926 [Bacteroidetes bacterium]|nr:hypothetical protein [Bacteroidota bacterium]
MEKKKSRPAREDGTCRCLLKPLLNSNAAGFLGNTANEAAQWKYLLFLQGAIPPANVSSAAWQPSGMPITTGEC